MSHPERQLRYKQRRPDRMLVSQRALAYPERNPQ